LAPRRTDWRWHKQEHKRENTMRELSETFMNDLLQPEDLLHPILARVKKDQTLMLAIRDGFINIYYRGGSILRVTEHSKGSYKPFFDPRYNKSEQEIPHLPILLKAQEDAKEWVDAFHILKYFMDDYLSTYAKPEREFQQLVARENNFSSISNASEYFISDIEVAIHDPEARFDMLAICWEATKRRSGYNCRPAFIEMKYGDNAIYGTAGLLKHLKDMDALIADKERYANLMLMIANQFNQLDQLGLLNFNKGQNFDKVKLNPNEKPEVIFILANHNPRGTGLKTILSTPEVLAYGKSSHFDLKFFVASFSGYALHTKNMLGLDEFRQLL
jgi:hypothetical protein